MVSLVLIERVDSILHGIRAVDFTEPDGRSETIQYSPIYLSDFKVEYEIPPSLEGFCADMAFAVEQSGGPR